MEEKIQVLNEWLDFQGRSWYREKIGDADWGKWAESPYKDGFRPFHIMKFSQEYDVYDL